MRASRSATTIGVVLVGAALVSPFVGCNALTHIGDYEVDCFGCISTTCGDFYAKCVVDPVCRQASICFQQCSPTGTIEGCTNQCSVDGGVTPAGTDLIQCIAKSCQLLCFGNQGGPPPPDTGTSGETGADTSADTTNDGTPSDGGCNTNAAPAVDSFCVSSRGASMVSLTVDVDAGTKRLCIDEREVSWDDYDKFIAGRGQTNSCGQIPECAWNKDFGAQVAPPSGSSGTYPVYGIDWCDAYAYCQWAGKRLCSGVDGKPAPDPAEALFDVWTFACSDGAGTQYPYGATYVATKCNTGTTAVTPTKSKTACVGTSAPYSGIFDMSGNVAEWEDNCPTKGTTPDFDLCATRGGSYSDADATTTCGANRPTPRNSTLGTIGFRCCAP